MKSKRRQNERHIGLYFPYHQSDISDKLVGKMTSGRLLILSLNLLFIFLLPSFFPACRSVETVTPSRDFRIVIHSVRNIEVYQRGRRGELLVRPVTGHVYKIHFPPMFGGYSEALLVKYNEFDPKTLKLVVIKEGTSTLAELSMEQLESLPSEDGNLKVLDLKDQ